MPRRGRCMPSCRELSHQAGNSWWLFIKVDNIQGGTLAAGCVSTVDGMVSLSSSFPCGLLDRRGFRQANARNVHRVVKLESNLNLVNFEAIFCGLWPCSASDIAIFKFFGLMENSLMYKSREDHQKND